VFELALLVVITSEFGTIDWRWHPRSSANIPQPRPVTRPHCECLNASCNARFS